MATRQASMEFFTCSFDKISCRWRLTVFILIDSLSAICLLINPLSISRSTCFPCRIICLNHFGFQFLHFARHRIHHHTIVRDINDQRTIQTQSQPQAVSVWFGNIKQAMANGMIIPCRIFHPQYIHQIIMTAPALRLMLHKMEETQFLQVFIIQIVRVYQLQNLFFPDRSYLIFLCIRMLEAQYVGKLP